MSQASDNLMKRLHFIMRASRYFMFQNKQPLAGQKRVLAVLKLEDGLTQNYLAEVLALQPGSLAELLKKMEAKGEITRASDDQDRRVKRVYLTSAGRKEAERIDEWANKQDTSAFFNGLSATEQEELSNYLEKIANGWDDDFKEQADRFVDPSYRMWAMNRWHKWAEEHNWSADEMRAACHHARGMHHHGCRPGSESADAEGRTCPNQRMRPPRRDFWREFWDNDKEL